MIVTCVGCHPAACTLSNPGRIATSSSVFPGAEGSEGDLFNVTVVKLLPSFVSLSGEFLPLISISHSFFILLTLTEQAVHCYLN